jgi:hypothetical protein
MELWEVVAREQVRQTIASHSHAGDRGRFDDLAACYTDDGSLQFSGEQPLVGREAIMASMRSIRISEPRPTHVRHNVTGINFTSVTPEEIEVSSYFFVVTDIGADHWGRYRDQLAPAGDHWLFRSRRIATDGFSDRSFFHPAET